MIKQWSEKTTAKNKIVTDIKNLIKSEGGSTFNTDMDVIFHNITEPHIIYNDSNFKIDILTNKIMKTSNPDNELIYNAIANKFMIHNVPRTDFRVTDFIVANTHPVLYKIRKTLFKSIQTVFEYEASMKLLSTFWDNKIKP